MQEVEGRSGGFQSIRQFMSAEMTQWLEAAQRAAGIGTKPNLKGGIGSARWNRPRMQEAQGRSGGFQSIRQFTGAEMTQWLEAAQRVAGVGAKPTEPTKSNPKNEDDRKTTTTDEIASVLSVLSEGGDAEAAPARTDELTSDAAAYLTHLRSCGAQSYGAVARQLGWGATRAWCAEAELRAAGWIRHHEHGRSDVHIAADQK